MGDGSSCQPRANKQYSFKGEHVDSLFKLLNKSNKLKLPEGRRCNTPFPEYVLSCVFRFPDRIFFIIFLPVFVLYYEFFI